MSANPHKSLPKLTARRSAATRKTFAEAKRIAALADRAEKAGMRGDAKKLAARARRLFQAAGKSGSIEGPVSRLPNPKIDIFWHWSSGGVSRYMFNNEAAVKAALASWRKIDPKGKAKRGKRNPVDEFETDEAEAFALGGKAARMLGHSRREARKGPKLFDVTWYSSIKHKRTGFVQPIEAHNATDAKRQAKAMITNDPKATNFVAKEVKRNPVVKTTWLTLPEDTPNARLMMAEVKQFRGKRGRAQYVNELIKRLDALERKALAALKKNPGLIDLAANLQAADFVQKYLGGGKKRKRNAGVFDAKYDQSETEAYERGFYDGSRGFTQGVNYAKPEMNAAYQAGKRDGVQAKRIFERANKRREKRKSNPSLHALSETFQGKATGSIKEYKGANAAPADLARIGRLIFFTLGQGRVSMPGVMVAVDRRERLWLVGSRVPMFRSKAKKGQRLNYGPITRICYETAKAHIEAGRRTEYDHKFDAPYPQLHVDDEGMPIIVGGRYKIKAGGITG